MLSNYPRIVISGLAGDSGKTIVSCGLLTCLKSRGMNVLGFKKGPDYIDTAWLSLSSDKPARNLDTYMMGIPTVKKSFLKNAEKTGLNIIEGNRGLFDGVDSKGTHSTAELAKLLQSPIIIVQDVSKVTRTAAASIAGCIKLDPDLKIKGVILNRVAGERHAKIAKEAIEEETGIPVVGSITKLSEKFILPSRHLGLITPDELEQKSIFLSDLKSIIEEYIDVSKILEIANNVSPLDFLQEKNDSKRINIPSNKKVKIGYFKDQSFSFYYPENFEMLAEAGAELIPISPKGSSFPEYLDALYIGGGFPEMSLPALAENEKIFRTIKKLVEEGLPIYAECGGLMYLAKEIVWKGKKYSLSGILPIVIQMNDKPQGHGYCEALIDNKNPFFKVGTIIKGHEFHYSKIYDYDPEIKSSLSVLRGIGCFKKRDGLTYKNVFATYIHTHALATPEWITGMIGCAKDYRNFKKNIQQVKVD